MPAHSPASSGSPAPFPASVHSPEQELCGPEAARPPEPTARHSRRRPLWASVVGLALVTGVAFGAGLVLRARSHVAVGRSANVAQPSIATLAPPSLPPSVKGPLSSAALPSGPLTVSGQALASPISAISAHSEAPAPADATDCVAAYFPEHTFVQRQDLGFVCSVSDPRKGATRIRVAIVVGGHGAATAGADEWTKLGWYQLAIYGILRRACCSADPLVQLPDEPPPCASLAGLIETLSTATQSGTEVEAATLAFEKGTLCLLRRREGPRNYPYVDGPYGGSQVKFAAFLKRMRERQH
jgi:hypothetical protein